MLSQFGGQVSKAPIADLWDMLICQVEVGQFASKAICALELALLPFMHVDQFCF